MIIGKIKEVYNDKNLPSIYDLIREKPIEHKAKILEYLRNGKIEAYAPGRVKDIISGQYIDCDLCCYTDGKYEWRSDTIYYFDKYNLKLDDGFILYVLRTK
ncbi:MAG: hypothetical protein IJD97_10475 [Clostridia bacterium]|nr:hypothetical protein [Clostridia bacterium]